MIAPDLLALRSKGLSHRRPFLGPPWTGLVGATAVPAVCDVPGVSHLDLGIVQHHGMVRR